LTGPKEWRVLMEFLPDCWLLVVAVGAGDFAVITSFHIPVGGAVSIGLSSSGDLAADKASFVVLVLRS
jgi:hypothetical protein